MKRPRSGRVTLPSAAGRQAARVELDRLQRIERTAREYVHEVDNPAPDYLMRRLRLGDLREALGLTRRGDS